MSKRIRIRILLFGLLLPFFNKTDAQPDFPKSPSDSLINYNIGQWLRSTKKYDWDSAIPYAGNIVDLTKKEFGEMSHAYAVALVAYLGYVYTVKGDYDLAHYYLKRGIDIFTALNDTANERYQNSIFHYGIVCYAMGANTEAVPALLKASALLKRRGDLPNYAQAVINLAGAYSSTGEYAKAESMDLQMKEMLDTLPKSGFIHYLIGCIYNNIAIVYTQTGNFQKALQYLQQSEMMERVPETGVSGSDHMTILLNLAEAYANAGRTDSALVSCKQVEDSLARKRNDDLYAKMLRAKACICRQRHNLTAAIRLYRQYKSMTDTLPVKPEDYHASLISLGRLYTDTRQHKPADSLFRQEIRYFRQSGLEYSFGMQQSLAGLCANLIAMGNYKEASDSLLVLCHLTFRAMDKNFPGMPEADQLNYRTALDGFFDLLYTCMQKDRSLKKELLAEAFRLELQRKNLVLINQVQLLGRIRNSADSSLLALYNTWLNNRQILSRQYSLPAGQRFFNIDSLEYLSGRLEKEVSAKSFSPITSGNDSRPLHLLVKQGPASAGIEFVRYNDKTQSNKDRAAYAAFIFKYGDTIPVFVHLCSEEALTRLMKDKKGDWIDRNQLTRKIYDHKGDGSRLLYSLIWQPMEPWLRNIQQVNYSPAGLMNNIAFNAVYDGNAFLMNRYTLHRYTSLKDLNVKATVPSRPGQISIWGNMNYDSANYTDTAMPGYTASLAPPGMKTVAQAKSISKAPLQPFDPAEISGIKEVFRRYNIPVTSSEYDYATEEKFKQEAAAIKGILHISTHGFYTPFAKASLTDNFISGNVNPLFRCGLAFSGVNYYWMKGTPRPDHEDGILTGYEVAQLDLHQVQLVTLSACETGLGDVTANEGNLGLERAFKLAGAGNLLVSLWEVPAKQTAELLSLFYTNWLNGKTPARALQMAEHAMQKKNYPPFFWAGFVLIE